MPHMKLLPSGMQPELLYTDSIHIRIYCKNASDEDIDAPGQLLRLSWPNDPINSATVTNH